MNKQYYPVKRNQKLCVISKRYMSKYQKRVFLLNYIVTSVEDSSSIYTNVFVYAEDACNPILTDKRCLKPLPIDNQLVLFEL